MNKPAAHLNAVPERTPLDTLATQHLEAKAAVAKAQATLNAINEEIIASIGTKDEGSFSIDCDGFKITTTQSLTRSVDPQLAKDVYMKLPRDIADGIFNWKPSLNLKLYRELDKYQPAHYATIGKAITTKAGKPTVTVKPLANGGGAA